jgi:hypothetical protein
MTQRLEGIGRGVQLKAGYFKPADRIQDGPRFASGEYVEPGVWSYVTRVEEA